MRDATAEDLALFGSLKGSACPAGHFFGDGERVVRKMLAFGVVERILCAPKWAETLKVPPGVEVRIAPLAALSEIVGYRLHSGVMALGKIPALRPPSGSFHLVLDHLSNTENVGAIVRSCAAFGVDGLVVGPDSASPWTRRAVRVAMGATLAIPIHEVPDVAEFCRQRGDAYAADIHGDRHDYRDVDWKARATIVVGAEDDGVSKEVRAACRAAVYIPMEGGWDCLNAAASAAVLLAEVRRQRRG